MIENDQEIILDSANNVFVGPDGYFKVVIDDFDGKTVKAWHVEDAKGNKTRNLAERAKGKHIDAMINASNRSVAHFTGRIASTLLTEMEAKRDALEKAQAKPKEKPVATGAISIKIDGKAIASEQPPAIVGDAVFVPLRAVFEALGATVEWGDTTGAVTITRGKDTIVLEVGDAEAKKNSETIKFSPRSRLMSKRAMVPLQFVSQALGVKASWDGDAQAVIIATK